MPGLQTIEVNPLSRAAAIKQLFLAEDQGEFQEFFDRAYPSAVQSGAKSWVGVDSEGRVVTHIARFSRRFTLGDRAVVGGILLNLIAARSHRTLLPALSLMRQMTSDSKAQNGVDFLYANPNAAATALLKAAGFSLIGELGRFVLPLAGRRWYSDASVRVYQTLVRLRAGNGTARVIEHDARHFDVGAFEHPAGQDPALRPIHSPEIYRQCLTGYPSGMDRWFTFQQTKSSARPCAAVLLRGGAANGEATMFGLSREPSTPLSAIVPPLAKELRRAGYSRLAVSTVRDTQLSRQLRQAGFVQRHETVPLVAYALTGAGADALRAVANWEITALDCDPYFP